MFPKAPSVHQSALGKGGKQSGTIKPISPWQIFATKARGSPSNSPYFSPSIQAPSHLRAAKLCRTVMMSILQLKRLGKQVQPKRRTAPWLSQHRVRRASQTWHAAPSSRPASCIEVLFNSSMNPVLLRDSNGNRQRKRRQHPGTECTLSCQTDAAHVKQRQLSRASCALSALSTQLASASVNYRPDQFT
jgi:hypothetical protein